MKKKVFSIVAPVLLVLGIVAALPAQPASATIFWCPDGVFCAYDRFGGYGTRWEYAISDYGPPGTCRKLPLLESNKWSSFWNDYNMYGNYQLAVDVFDSANCTGNWKTIYNNVAGDFYGTTWGAYNDKVSSIRITTYN